MRFLGWFLAVVGLIAVVLGIGYFALRRADIPYESLAARYEVASSRYVDLDGGIRLHYRDEGQANGPVLLLIHGFSASTHTWEGWSQRLGDTYRVISIDLPGHGLTRAPAGYQASIEAFRDVVQEFADAMQLQSFAIAGNSMGGNVAWEYALAHPERVEALVLVDSSGWPSVAADEDDGDGPLIFKLLRNPVLGPLLRDLDNSQLARQGLEASFYNAALVDDAMVDRYVSLARAPGHRDILLQITLGFRERNYATPERLASLANERVLIMFGDTDRLVPTSDGARFQQAIAGSELIIFEQTGHIPQEEKPEESAMAVREFLYSVYEPSALAATATP
jgi:pimeloyl-ACP methyl ester carboxylesterase